MKVFVLRSVSNGAPPWKGLSQSPAVGQSFEDDAFIVENRTQQVFYRLVGVDSEGKQHFSPVVGLYDKLTKREYGAVHKIISSEYRRMRGGNGLPMLHYVPLAEGEPNPAYDPETGQAFIATCPNDGSYGLPYIGGYGPPLQTWVELMQLAPEPYAESPAGMGADTTQAIRARMLAYPKPVPGHLLVHTVTDNRYAVSDNTQPYLFKGLVPVAYDVELRLLNRNDPRYGVPVPILRDDPIRK